MVATGQGNSYAKYGKGKQTGTHWLELHGAVNVRQT